MKNQDLNYAQQLLAEADNVQQGLIAEITLGMPSKDCRNFGICRINPIKHQDALENLFKKTILNKTIANLFSVSDHQLEIAFIRKLMNPLTEQKYFSGSFRVQEALSLPAPICQQLGIESFTVAVGQYEIETTPTLYIVRFT